MDMKCLKRKCDINIIKRGLIIILLMSCAWEVVKYPTIESLLICSTSLASLMLYNKYVFRLYIIIYHPISFFVISNLFLFMYLPIPVTLMDGNSAYHHLYIPKTTFVLQFLYFAITVLAFSITIKYNTKTICKTSRFLKDIGYFPKVNIKILWILGLLGCIPRLILMVSDIQIGAGLLGNLAYFMYAPICILFSPLFGNEQCSMKMKYCVYIYIVLIMLLLIGTNARHDVITSIIIILLLSFYYYFSNDKGGFLFSVKKVIVCILSIFLVTGPFSDLATAMVIVRSERTSISLGELIAKTYDVFLDKDTLAKYRDLEKAKWKDVDLSYKIWDEHYVSNVFLERFCNYRVVDASIFHALRTNMSAPLVQSHFIDKLLELPPNPIPSILFGVTKGKQYSQMDMLFADSSKNAPFGGLRVGGDVGLGLSVFGVFYFIIQFIVYILFFTLTSALCYRQGSVLVFSIFTSIKLMDIFNLFTVHSGIVRHISFLIWSFWYGSIFSIIVFVIIRFIFFHEKMSFKNIRNNVQTGV